MLTTGNSVIILVLAISWVLIAPAGHADQTASPDCDAKQVLEELQDEVTGPLSEQQLASARIILNSYCRSEVDLAIATAEVAPEAELGAEPSEEADAPPTLFGIEFRKADEDAKGHDRLKKR